MEAEQQSLGTWGKMFLVAMCIGVTVQAVGIIAGLGDAWLLLLLAVFLGVVPAVPNYLASRSWWIKRLTEQERQREEALTGTKVVGAPPKRDCIARAKIRAMEKGHATLQEYLMGWEVDTGNEIMRSFERMCRHLGVWGTTGIGKSSFMLSLAYQHMRLGGGSSWLDSKRDGRGVAYYIAMAIETSRVDDVVLIDPWNPVHRYNFLDTPRSPSVKVNMIVKACLADKHEAGEHYKRLARHTLSCIIPALEALKKPYTIKDVAATLTSFEIVYPKLRGILTSLGAQHEAAKLSELAGTYRDAQGVLDAPALAHNLRGIGSELNSIVESKVGQILCHPRTDVRLTAAMWDQKLIYCAVPRMEDSESAARMMRIISEDVRVSVGEVIAESETRRLEVPHLLLVDEASTTFTEEWSDLFELSRAGNFALVYGVQSFAALSQRFGTAWAEKIIGNTNTQMGMQLRDVSSLEYMSRYFGKKSTVKKSYGVGFSEGTSAAALAATALDPRAKKTVGEQHSMTATQQLEEAVPPDDLKGLQQGISWVDMGDNLVRMKVCYLEPPKLPAGWNAREHLVIPERGDAEEVALNIATWVDEQLIAREDEAIANEIKRREHQKAKEQQREQKEQQQREKQNAAKAPPPGKNAPVKQSAKKKPAKRAAAKPKKGPARVNEAEVICLETHHLEHLWNTLTYSERDAMDLAAIEAGFLGGDRYAAQQLKDTRDRGEPLTLTALRRLLWIKYVLPQQTRRRPPPHNKSDRT